METSIVGVGVGITDRFRTVVEDKAARIEHLAPRAQRVDIKITHRAYHNGRVEDDTVELTLTGKGPLVRAEATDGDKFAALDLAVDKLCEQLRRAKDKRVDARQHPRGAKFEKGSGAIQGIDLQPASVDVLRAVATGEIPIITGQRRRGGLHACRHPHEGIRRGMDVRRRCRRPHGAGRPRLLPLHRRPHRPPERRLPPQGLGLRRHLADGCRAARGARFVDDSREAKVPPADMVGGTSSSLLLSPPGPRGMINPPRGRGRWSGHPPLRAIDTACWTCSAVSAGPPRNSSRKEILGG